jgi:hypothetical protein
MSHGPRLLSPLAFALWGLMAACSSSAPDALEGDAWPVDAAGTVLEGDVSDGGVDGPPRDAPGDTQADTDPGEAHPAADDAQDGASGGHAAADAADEDAPDGPAPGPDDADDATVDPDAGVAGGDTESDPDTAAGDVGSEDAGGCPPSPCQSPPCSLTVNANVPVTTLSGRITLAGAAWPMTTPLGPNAYGASPSFFLRAADTGALHPIARIDYGGASPYTRTAGSDVYQTVVLPGTYDLIYSRGLHDGLAWSNPAAGPDPVITGHRVLRTVTLGAGAQTLDIDLPVTRLTGRITYAGGAWPATSPFGGAAVGYLSRLYLRARDTGVPHRLGTVTYAGQAAPFTLVPGSDEYATDVVAGEYDILYLRGEVDGFVWSRKDGDPVVNGLQVLRTVWLRPGRYTLDVDVPLTTLTGRLTLNGGTWPQRSGPNAAITFSDPSFFLRSHETQAMHPIAIIDYNHASPYERSAQSDNYLALALPGVYDLIYVRGLREGVAWTRFEQDPIVNAYKRLRTVTIQPGRQTLDIDVAFGAISGQITLGGAPWPATSTRGGDFYRWAPSFFLKEPDTGVLHRIATVTHGSTPPYALVAGSDRYATTVPTGTYDLIYIRGEQQGVVSRQLDGDPVVNGHRILRSVTVSPGAQTLDLDLPVMTLSGRLTLDGGAWPETTAYPQARPAFFLRAHDTEVLHDLAQLPYSASPPYARPAGSENFRTTMVPGRYDILYARRLSEGGVLEQTDDDPILNGYRILGQVTLSANSRPIDIDVRGTAVAGTLTIHRGATWPMSSPSSGDAASVLLSLQAHDTGVLHRLATIPCLGAGPCTRPVGSERFASRLPPGAYALVYQRGLSYGAITPQLPGDPVPNGHRILDPCVVVP